MINSNYKRAVWGLAVSLGVLVYILSPGSVLAGGSPAKGVVRGLVLQILDGEPVAGAEIWVDGESEWVASGVDGSFFVRELLHGSLYGIVTIHVRAVGYEPYEAEYNFADGLALLEIYLQPLNVYMEDVVVTATRTSKTLKEVPVPTEVISRQDLEMSGAVTVQDALDDLTSIQFSPDSHGANILMNGLGPNYVLFLVDGERIAGEVRGNIDFSRLNAASVERIEVVKGGASSLYGSNAIGGVVNIITRKVGAPLEVNLDSRFAEFNETVWSGSVGVHKSGFKSRTEGIYKSSDGYDLNSETVSRTVEEYEDFSLGQRFDVSIDAVNVFLKGNYYQRERFDAAREYTNIHHKDYGRSFAFGSSFKMRKHDHLDLSWSSDNYESRNVVGPPIDEERRSYENTRDTGRLSGTVSFHEKHQLVVGLEYDQEKLFSMRVLNENQKAHSWNTYLQDDFFISDNWSVVLGARLDSHSEYGSNLSPKMTGMHHWGDWTFRASYGHGFRAPTLKELYLDWDHGGGGPFVYGNPDLNAENSRNGSFSIELDRPKWNASVSLFRNDLEEMIDTRQDLNDPNVNYYYNVDQAYTQGVEILGVLHLGFGIRLSGGYAFLDTEDKTTGFDLYGRPKSSVTFKLAYENRDHGLLFNIRGKWISDKLIISEEDPVTSEIIEYRQGAHSLWNLTLDKKVYKQSSVYAGVDNVFDYLDVEYLANPGRVVYGGFRIRY